MVRHSVSFVAVYTAFRFTARKNQRELLTGGKMAARGLRFLLLASAAGCAAALVAAAFRKQRKARALPKRTLKIIFAGTPTEEQI